MVALEHNIAILIDHSDWYYLAICLIFCGKIFYLHFDWIQLVGLTGLVLASV